jgi:glycosyltransferase involved in cell wall biosynthesis
MDLSILIPSRNEMFLGETVKSILENIEADTEIIVTLDGACADPEITQHERVNIIYVPEAIGQRAATNIAAKLAKGKYVMKVDAHCAFDKGFDRKMVEAFKETGDNVTMVPIMHNLWAFDWKCYKCGSRWYQGPTPTRCMRQERGPVPNEKCDETKNFRRRITWKREAKKGESARKNWKSRMSPASTSYCFDSEPHFQYFREFEKRDEYQKSKETGFTETMSLQGSCWMLTKEKYAQFAEGREELGSWGNEGIEMALKTWLSGGKVLVNHNTWYAHLFRTQGGDFGFPYHQGGKHVSRTKKRVWELFFNNNWKPQIYPVSWLLEKFWPATGWNEEKLKELKNKESLNK